MYCDRCGTNLQGDVRFCPTCGRNFGAAPPPPPTVSRVGGNLRTLAILWVVYSAFRILPGLFLRSMDSYGWPFITTLRSSSHGIVRTVGSVFVITGVWPV